MTGGRCTDKEAIRTLDKVSPRLGLHRARHCLWGRQMPHGARNLLEDRLHRLAPRLLGLQRSGLPLGISHSSNLIQQGRISQASGP